jgi:hypothetical protein
LYYLLSMTEIGPEVDTIIEMTFSRLVQQIGAPLVRQVFERGIEAWETGGDGVTFSNTNETANLTLQDDRAVSFKFGEWGPYKLPFERAEEILAAEE